MVRVWTMVAWIRATFFSSTISTVGGNRLFVKTNDYWRISRISMLRNHASPPWWVRTMG
jgi:hypothetical protein